VANSTVGRGRHNWCNVNSHCRYRQRGRNAAAPLRIRHLEIACVESAVGGCARRASVARATASITLDTYGHLFPPSWRRWATGWSRRAPPRW
jgi:hypothetical protein